MKLKKPESHANHVNVVPMVDVIMCLIIFYMLAAKIGVDTGEDEKIEIPYAQLGKEIKAMDNTLLVNVREDPVTRVAEVSAMVDQLSGKREPLILEGGGTGRRLLDALMYLRFGKDRKPGGFGENADNDKLELVVRGDKDLSFGVLQKVLVDASQAKITKLNFQTSTKPNEG